MIDYEAMILDEADAAYHPELNGTGSDDDYCDNCGDFKDHPVGPCDASDRYDR